jgi:pimeloyl-ACP methyl ester carboxylesterase
MIRRLLSLLAPVALSTAALAASPSAPVQTYVQAPGPLGPLKGTMLAPASGRLAMMLIIPGSGPTDRDGNNPLGVKAATYRLLAGGLAERGIGTVRIDKRGMFASAAAVADGNAVTVDDYVADVGAWISVIRKETGVSCVWLLGHSEGGIVALAAAQKLPDICGLVLVSAAGRPLGEVLRMQLRANWDRFSAFATIVTAAPLFLLSRAKAARHVSTSSSGNSRSFQPSDEKVLPSRASRAFASRRAIATASIPDFPPLVTSSIARPHACIWEAAG